MNHPWSTAFTNVQWLCIGLSAATIITSILIDWLT